MGPKVTQKGLKIKGRSDKPFRALSSKGKRMKVLGKICNSIWALDLRIRYKASTLHWWRMELLFTSHLPQFIAIHKVTFHVNSWELQTKSPVIWGNYSVGTQSISWISLVFPDISGHQPHEIFLILYQPGILRQTIAGSNLVTVFKPWKVQAMGWLLCKD